MTKILCATGSSPTREFHTGEPVTRGTRRPSPYTAPDLYSSGSWPAREFHTGEPVTRGARRLVLAVSGLLATVGLMGDVLRQRRHIKSLIAQLQEER